MRAVRDSPYSDTVTASGSCLCDLELIHPKRGSAFHWSSLPAAQSHNHTGTRASMGGKAGWQQTLSSGLVPLETSGPISATKSRLSLLRGPPAVHGNSTALEAAVPLPISQMVRNVSWAASSAVSLWWPIPPAARQLLHSTPAPSVVPQLHPPLLWERDNHLPSHPVSASPHQVSGDCQSHLLHGQSASCKDPRGPGRCFCSSFAFSCLARSCARTIPPATVIRAFRLFCPI